MSIRVILILIQNFRLFTTKVAMAYEGRGKGGKGLGKGGAKRHRKVRIYS